jgi:hypothetical protein
VTRSALPVIGAPRLRVGPWAALLGGLAVVACSFQDFDYLKEGKNDATGGAAPSYGDAGFAGYDPWHDDGRGGRRPGNWGGAPGFDGGVPAGGSSTGGASTAATGGRGDGTQLAGAAGT